MGAGPRDATPEPGLSTNVAAAGDMHAVWRAARRRRSFAKIERGTASIDPHR